MTEVYSILDVSRPTKKCRLFNGNIAILAEAFNRLMRADREEMINTPVGYYLFLVG